MKWILTYLFVSLTMTAFCQGGQIVGVIQKRDTFLDFKYLTVVLLKDSAEINGIIPDSSGKFLFTNVPEGVYSLALRQFGLRDAITEKVAVVSNSSTKLHLPYPPPCEFVYSKGEQPKCVNEHTDNIIPIVYGLPTKRTMKKAEKGAVRLAGCIVTDCDPKYYCKLHKREL